MNEKVQHDIDSLIASENDPKQRALMIVLQSINRSLIANTIATQQTQTDVEKHRADFSVHLKNFEAHAVNEEAIMNKGKGAWVILSVVLSLAQALVLYGWNVSRAETEVLKARVYVAEMEQVKSRARIEQLEKAQ